MLYGKMLLPKAEKPLPCVILCHGMGSDHRTMKPSAERLARKGIASLLFDFRGHGKSGGTCDDNITKDILAASDYLARHPEVDRKRIALVGHSMGAMAAVLAAPEMNSLCALVSLSCASGEDVRLQDILPLLSQKIAELGSKVVEYPRLGPPYWLGHLHGVLAWLWMWLRGYRVRIDLEKSLPLFSMREGIKAAVQRIKPYPILFVHCEGDKAIPYQHSIRLYEEAKPPKELLLVKGGSHSTPLFPGRVRKRWLDWLVSVLSGERASLDNPPPTPI